MTVVLTEATFVKTYDSFKDKMDRLQEEGLSWQESMDDILNKDFFRLMIVARKHGKKAVECVLEFAEGEGQREFAVERIKDNTDRVAPSVIINLKLKCEEENLYSEVQVALDEKCNHKHLIYTLQRTSSFNE